MINKQTKRAIFIVWTATIIAAVILFSFSSKQWPLVCGDAIAYWPPIIHGDKIGEFHNPIWTAATMYDPAGKGRLTYHGFLLQYSVRLLGGATYPAIYNVICVFGSIMLMVFSACLTIILIKSSKYLSGWRITCLACLPLALTHLFMGVFSRPEALVMLWAALLCLVFVGDMLHWTWKAVLAGILIGVCGLTSPISGIIMGMLAATFAALKMTPIQGLNWLLLCLIFSLVFAAAIFFGFYPFNLADWVLGCQNHAKRAVWPSGLGDHMFFWIQEARYTGLAPLVLSMMVLLPIKCILKKSVSRFHGLLKICALVALAGACWYFGVRQPARCYNLQAFAPCMLMILGAWIVTGKREQSISLRFLLPVSIVTIAIFASSLGIVRNVILFQYARSHGMRYAKAADALNCYIEATSDVVDVSIQFLTLSSSERVRGVTLSQVNAKYFMMAQTYSGRCTPPDIDGYELVEDRFSRYVPYLLGVKIASSPGGYNYAIYRRLDKLGTDSGQF